MTLYVIDIFCGAGGYSQGAADAGAKVAVAVDCWDAALAVHRAHHPAAVHLKKTLGDQDPAELAAELRSYLPALQPGQDFLLVHASPPCQNISGVNVRRNLSTGLALVDYSVRLIQAIAPDYFTIEQVSEPAVKRLFESHGIAYTVARMERQGVPQHRRRLLGYGGFDATALVEAAPQPCRNLLVPPPTTVYVGGTSLCPTRVSNKVYQNRRRVVADLTLFYTVTSNDFRYFDKDMKRVGTVSLEEKERIQTFPTGYATGVSSAQGRRVLGTLIANAVPPLFAKCVVQSVLNAAPQGVNLDLERPTKYRLVLAPPLRPVEGQAVARQTVAGSAMS